MLVGRYPSWGASNESGTELHFESMPASQVFSELLDLLEVYCSIAEEFELGLGNQSPGPIITWRSQGDFFSLLELNHFLFLPGTARFCLNQLSSGPALTFKLFRPISV